jgi:hypothetical protein
MATYKPTVTIGGAPAGYQAVDPFDALIQRLNTSSKNVDKVLADYATATKPLTRVEQAALTAPDKAIATNARRDLQQANIELAQLQNIDKGLGGGDDAAKAALLAKQEADRIAEEKRRAGQSAYDLLYSQFAQYGMGALVDPLKQFIIQGLSPAEFTLRLRDTDAYKKRFAANAARIAKGLAAIDEATYINLEDQYQNVMRNYGLPASYYVRGDMGRQEGFEKFIANDVSSSELEDRIATAQQRVLNSNPEVLQALKQFYPDINNADILAYTLDPENGLTNIKRKVTAAEIGGAALAQGLQAQGGTAESLAGYGVTKAQAQQGYQDIASILPRGSQLADIYGEQPYTQQTAEAEVFNTQGSADAAARRRKLKSLEEASFGGSSGVGALGRDKAIYGGTQGQAGLY